MRGPGVWTRGQAADVDKPSGSDLLWQMLLPFASASGGSGGFTPTKRYSDIESDVSSFRTRLI
jgi:hypothetical protein